MGKSELRARVLRNLVGVEPSYRANPRWFGKAPMVTPALVLFAFAAILGITVAVAIFKKKETSKPVALTHGASAAVGLIILILSVVNHPQTLLISAVVLLVIVAIGGAVLFVNDLRKKTGPVALVVVHALAAITAVVLVLLVAIQ